MSLLIDVVPSSYNLLSETCFALNNAIHGKHIHPKSPLSHLTRRLFGYASHAQYTRP